MNWLVMKGIRPGSPQNASGLPNPSCARASLRRKVQLGPGLPSHPCRRGGDRVSSDRIMLYGGAEVWSG